jgi:hypothetical protein
MRAGASLCFSALAILSCTRILGIDGHYVLDVEHFDGSPAVGSGGTLDANFGTGGDVSTGGTGEGTGGTGGLTGAGGIIASGGISAGTGGRGTDGGSNETGGASGSGGTDGQAPCDPPMKSCNGKCVTPDPSVGCAPTGCNRCSNLPPVDGYLVCTGDQCDFACQPGFTKDAANGSCKPPATATGGSGGSGGAGSIGSRCTKATPLSPSTECKNCGVFPGCCNPVTGLRCGCLYVAACI